MISAYSNNDVCIQVTLSRNAQGLGIFVKTSAIVEEFARQLGDGTAREITDVPPYHNLWMPVHGDSLQIWNGNRMNEALCEEGRNMFQSAGRPIDLGGEGLFGGAGGTRGAINMSFLRLVGVSNPEGVSFIIPNVVMSLEKMRALKNQINAASQFFYNNYIRPAELTSLIVKAKET